MFGLVSIGLALCAIQKPAPPAVLIVADEFPAMETLARQLRRLAGVESRLVPQDAMPGDLAPYRAVLVYIHGALHEQAEHALIRYTEAGGKLVALHHSISSGKRRNRDWFRFLGVSLPEGDVANGGYKWIEGVTMSIVDVDAGHPITTRGVRYDSPRLGRRAIGGRDRDAPGFVLHDTEVYLNHVLVGPHTVLLGLDFTDPTTETTYHQDTAGWLKPAGKGWVLYFMPGHTAHEFEHPAYARIIANAVQWAPPARSHGEP